MYFRDVAGQSIIKEKLIGSVKRDRVSHAQLISGLPGSGGLPLAVAYARYLHCSNKGETESCGTCDGCKKMDKLIHPDVYFTYPVIPKKSGTPPLSTDYIKPWRELFLKHPYISYRDWMDHIGAENKQGNITVSEGREIIKKCYMKPFLGGYKIFIIWLPEFLRESGNVLLKILEEPPGDAVFMLVTENPGMVLTTILSRTQQVYLPKLSDDDVLEGLNSRFDIEEKESKKVAHLADGNFRNAITMAQSGFENDYFKAFMEWTRLCYATDPYQLMQKIEKMAANGREAQKNFLHFALHIVREAMLMRENSESLTRLDGEEESFVKNFSKVVHRQNIQPMAEALEKAHYYIERNANAKIVLLNLSLQMNKFLRMKPS